MGVSPGEIVVARKTGVPRAYDLMLDCIDYYCIRPVLIPLLRRYSPYVNHCVCDIIV